MISVTLSCVCVRARARVCSSGIVRVDPASDLVPGLQCSPSAGDRSGRGGRRGDSEGGTLALSQGSAADFAPGGASTQGRWAQNPPHRVLSLSESIIRVRE